MIGVFDSGVGGLSILNTFLNDHPQYNYIYLGDNANVPYGNKSAEMIYNYSTKAVDFLYSKGCKLIIFACNSASAQALRRVQKDNKYPDLKILGVIRPIAEKIASLSNINKVGIIGTRATIDSRIYEQELADLGFGAKIYRKATPLLVPLVEEFWIKKPETKMILKKYLRELKMKQIEVLVLACTHYPFLLKDIVRIMGKKCLVLDSSKIVSDSLGDYLKRHSEIKLSKKSKNSPLFYCTDNLESFKALGEFFMSKKIDKIEKVDLN